MAAWAAAALGGCSISLPSSNSAALVDFEPTATIPSKPRPAGPAQSADPTPLSRHLDAEDWRRAKAALGVALDPQGNGATVAWSNPQNGRAGSFVSVAAPYPVDGQVCRAFVAKIHGDASEYLQGSACRVSGTDDWELKSVKPFKEG